MKLNGKDLGTLWKSPFRVEVTGAAMLYVAMVLALISALQLFARFLRDARAAEEQ